LTIVSSPQQQGDIRNPRDSTQNHTIKPHENHIYDHGRKAFWDCIAYDVDVDIVHMASGSNVRWIQKIDRNTGLIATDIDHVRGASFPASIE
jgi:glucose dehydrogenase